ncbi:hypothetical protein HMPREF1567_3522 [Providencia alcalifaciens PAL-2]|nr:hypothetical protein HMPREF1567_3522 [Providencia alcalifaciens PAL-2]
MAKSVAGDSISTILRAKQWFDPFKPLATLHILILSPFGSTTEQQALFNDTVTNSGTDKTAWIVSAIKEKLNRPDSSLSARMLSLEESL